MNLSNFKLGIYDLLGLVIPGMILVCESGITLRGWVNFRTSLNHMSGTFFTLLLVVSFVLGHLVQPLPAVCRASRIALRAESNNSQRWRPRSHG